MAAHSREELIQRLEQARSHLEKCLPKVDPTREIYPGWTFLQLLVHISGWDEDTLASLVAHQHGTTLNGSAMDGFDAFNQRAISSRKDLNLEQVIEEWQAVREKLVTLIAALPEEKFTETLVASWGERIGVTELVEVFIGHEESHTRDLQEWLKNPNHPLGKKGT